MASMKTSRKRRSDRVHLIYVLTNLVTGEEYVGLTVRTDRSGKKSLASRWTRHIGRAMLHDKDWRLCESIRMHGAKSFTTRILQFVRGKSEAHAIETRLKKTGLYTLNTI